jgi:uncharacterized protein YhaN
MTIQRSSFRSQSSQNANRSKIAIKSHNVMESLVIEEVNKQLQSLPLKTSKLVKLPDVLAYTLNRLPSLYATSKIGWQRQLNRAKNEFSEKIEEVVRQSIIAVQRDPLHISDLTNNVPETEELNQATAALENLKTVLQREDLSWENLANVVEESLGSTDTDKRTGSNYSRSRPGHDIWNNYRY